MKHGIERYFINLMVAWCSLACDEDAGSRLQTDQSFEGEEMYTVSKLLDEHLPFILQRQAFFTIAAPATTLPDCPMVTINELSGNIELVFGPNTCEASSNKRRGKIILRYSKTPLTTGDSVIIDFENYAFDSHQVKGTRKLRLVGLNRERRVFEEFTRDLLIITPENHSTRIHSQYVFEILETGGRISKVNGQGTAQGRNRGGRKFEAEIQEDKEYDGTCMHELLLRPSSGVESWSIERTSTRNIIHRQTFYNEGGCTTHTLIRLDEGVEMKKTP